MSDTATRWITALGLALGIGWIVGVASALLWAVRVLT